MRIRKGLLFLAPLLLLIDGRCTTLGPPDVASSVVYIDSQANAHPNPAHVRRGQWMHFLLASGTQSVEADFLDNQGQEGTQAWGRVRPDATLGRHTYKINNAAAQKQADPDVMIDP